MDINEIKSEVRIWNRWGYNAFTQELICFTDKIVDFDDDKDEWIITYKPKAWIQNVTCKQAFQLLREREFRKTFRFAACDGDWFTERESAEKAEQNGEWFAE